MKLKRFALVLTLLALLTAAVSANEADPAHSKPAKHTPMGLSLTDAALLEATGLEAEALRAALAKGATLAELIAANDGDVESVIADIAAQMTDDINANVATWLEGLAEHINDNLEADHSSRGPWGQRWLRHPRIFRYAGVSDAILEATALDASELRAALAAGATLAELIEANESDVTDVAAAIEATIADEITAAAAQRIEGLQENLSELFNSDLSERWRHGRRGRMKPRAFFGFWGVYGQPTAEQPAA